MTTYMWTIKLRMREKIQKNQREKEEKKESYIYLLVRSDLCLGMKDLIKGRIINPIFKQGRTKTS